MVVYHITMLRVYNIKVEKKSVHLNAKLVEFVSLMKENGEKDPLGMLPKVPWYEVSFHTDTKESTCRYV